MNKRKRTSWYQLHVAQIPPALKGYDVLGRELGGIAITGNGANITINVAGKNISVRPILEEAVGVLHAILVENGVKEINTDSLGIGIQGLAVSSEPGKVHVDVAKIAHSFEQSVSSLSPVTQTDGTTVDPDVQKQLVSWLTNEIRGELLGTSAHESMHHHDYFEKFKEWKTDPTRSGPRFNLVQEAPGPLFEKRMRERYNKEVKYPFNQ